MQPLCSVNAPRSANDEQLDGVVRLLGRHFDSAAVLVGGAGSARHIWASPGLSDARLAKIIGIGETTPTTLVWPLLVQAGTRLGTLYLQFDQGRKRAEALEADQQDEADLQALETKIKRRPQK